MKRVRIFILISETQHISGEKQMETLAMVEQWKIEPELITEQPTPTRKKEGMEGEDRERETGKGVGKIRTAPKYRDDTEINLREQERPENKTSSRK